jgi:hypothetical protein
MNAVDIIIEIPDIVVDTTVLKRKAKLESLVYNMDRKEISISWIIITYSANPDGTYGEDLSAIVPRGTREQFGNNNVLVNPVTGVPVTDPNEPSIGQYDFFNNIGENMPIKIHDVIRQFGATLQNS